MGKKQERDFKKVKEKGYGKKAAPRSAVSTSFRTRALVMPYQKVSDESRRDRANGENKTVLWLFFTRMVGEK